MTKRRKKRGPSATKGEAKYSKRRRSKASGAERRRPSTPAAPDTYRVKAKLLKYMEDNSSRPLSVGELISRLSVPKGKGAQEALTSNLDSLAGAGKLVRLRGARYGIPDKMNLISGTLTCHPDGFGFVIPESGGDDIFIGTRGMNGAIHGDIVVARVDRVKGPGKREGSIQRILERGHKRIIGRYCTEGGHSYLIPSDSKILYDFLIPKANVPSPEGRRKAKRPENGEIVEIEVTKWPPLKGGRVRGGGYPEGVILEILGDPDDPDVEVEVILRKYGLAGSFPPEVLEELTELPKEVSGKIIEEELKRGRVDLRGKRSFTIDGEDARDFDDAVAIEKRGSGYILYVSIADVSHYVPVGSGVDGEAYGRGTSTYFPDRCIPMLPEALSNGICSLNPHVDRLTMTAEIEFTKGGRVKVARFYESIIKSVDRLTYNKVHAMLTSPQGEGRELAEEYSHILPDLKLMESLAEKLTERRLKDGSIDFDIPEPKILFDEKGDISDVVRSDRHESHRLIEEFMLAANREVASRFSHAFRKDRGDEDGGGTFIYRVHPEPPADKVAKFKDFAATLGLHLKGKGSGPRGPKAFQTLLHQGANLPEVHLLNHVMLRTIEQAVYSTDNSGHFGLAFKEYTHFTSPIRRYPDLIVHRLLKGLINSTYDEKFGRLMKGYLPEAAHHTSETERRSMAAEREIMDLKRCQFMIDKVGLDFDGKVSGVASFGIFVELHDFFVEGLVRISSLGDDYYIYEEAHHRLRGDGSNRVFTIGDEVTVTVVQVDLERRQIEMELKETY